MQCVNYDLFICNYELVASPPPVHNWTVCPIVDRWRACLASWVATRVTALCSGLAAGWQEAFEKGSVPGQSLAFVLDTALRRVLFERLEGYFADQGQVLGGLVVTRRVVIFAEGDIELPVQGVFDGPVAAHKPVGLDRGERPAADGVARLSDGFGLPLLRVSAFFHPVQGVRPGPAALSVYPARVRLRPVLLAHRHVVAGVGPARARRAGRQGGKAAGRRSAWASREGWWALRPSRWSPPWSVSCCAAWALGLAAERVEADQRPAQVKQGQ